MDIGEDLQKLSATSRRWKVETSQGTQELHPYFGHGAGAIILRPVTMVNAGTTT
jgi:hypothetical protein